MFFVHIIYEKLEVFFRLKMKKNITILFHNDIQIHLQGWDQKEDPLPLCQLVCKVGNQK